MNRRGARVATLTHNQASQVIDIRHALEPIAVRYLLAHNDPDRLRPLRQILDEMARATDTENWANLVALDMKFHETDYPLADSPMLLKAWETLRIGVFPLNESSQL